MIIREDFFSLFFPTVEKYFREVRNESIEIRFATCRHDCNCVIRPRLSAVTSIHPTRRAKSFFYSEWNIRNSFLKNIAAKTYVWLLTNTGKLFCDYRFSFMPKDSFSNDYVIAPNNRTIRIFDYKTKTVGCICKEGFSNRFMRNQIEFRKTHNYVFLLKMIDYGDRWFTEPIMKGHPLARVCDNQLYADGIKQALECIKTVAKPQIHYVSSHKYSECLKTKILNYLMRAESEKEIKTSLAVRSLTEYALNCVFAESDILIPVSESHGDLQTGNIWMDENRKVWIYDWETVDTRSIWFDPVVLSYSLRRKNGWAGFFNDMRIERLEDYLASFPAETASPRIVKSIILLEDMLFYFEDMLELPGSWGNKIFDEFILLLEGVVIKNSKREIICSEE